VLYEGREQVAIALAQSIQQILERYQDGILVTSVTMQNVQPPEQVQAAFDDAVKASQDRERQKNEAQAYANDVIPRANGTAARLIQEAQGYKARVEAQAQGDAARFDAVQAAYAAAPAVTRERLYLDTMQQIYSRSSKVLIDAKGNNSMIYLPLDKLLSQDGATTAAVPRAPGPAARAGAPTGASDAVMTDSDLVSPSSDATDPLRSRSVFRSRDRSEALQDVR
jgi:membrane protease subunit HflK